MIMESDICEPMEITTAGFMTLCNLRRVLKA
jgi:hypothetical protein